MRRCLVVLLVLAVLSSCGRGKEEKDRIIPKEDLVSVLEDIYLANGIFSLTSMRKMFPGTDSLSNYRDIVAKYGYTLEDLRKTINHYTHEERIEKLVQVYEEVVKDLSTLQEKSFEEETLGPAGRKHMGVDDLWVGDREYHLPRQGQRNKIPFKVKIPGPGMYTLSLMVKVHRDDGSRKPYIHVWFSDGKGKKIEWRKQTLRQDGEWHQYILAKKLTDPLYGYLEGFLMDDENRDGHYIKQVDIRDIRLDIKPLADGFPATGVNGP